MNLLKVAFAVAFLGIVGCQTMPYQPYARDVKKKPQAGGTIALHAEHKDEDRAKATQMMSSNCGSNEVKVVEEGEVVVGQTTNTNANQNSNYGNKQQVGTLFGMPVTSGSDASTNVNSTATTTQLKEWQITYECVAAAAMPATPAAKTSSTSKAKPVTKKN